MARIFPDSAYIGGAPLGQAYFRALDTAQFQSVNGDQGGTWSPTGAIGVAGAGMWACAPWTLSAGAKTTLATGKVITHADGDYATLSNTHTGNTRTLYTSFGEALDDSGGTIVALFDAATYGVKNYAPSNTHRSSTVPMRLKVPLAVHNGATISTVVFSFAVGAAHASAPQNLPQFRLFAVDTSGNVTTWQSGSAGGYATFPTPASGALWYAAGATQTYTYSLTGVPVVDTSKFTYFAEVIDESGTNSQAGNIFYSAAVTFIQIPDMRFY